jgi:hypothetical protein
VWVTVELRKSEGTPATGIDGSKLSFSLTGGGTTYQPVTRVGPGLFRFALAGRPQDLGSVITLDVAYGGSSLGQYAIPVGWDPWSATDPSVTAVGACALTRPRASTSFGSLGIAVALTAATARRRRRDRRQPVR